MANETTIFNAVFYDINKPKDYNNALYKTNIGTRTWANITDNMSTQKTIELVSSDGIINVYRIKESMTFYLKNFIDNTMWAICLVEKIR